MDELVIVDVGEEITYCYLIENTGEATLCDIVMTDPAGYTYELEGCLAPNDGPVYIPPFSKNTPDGGEDTTAKVVGIPVDDWRKTPVTDMDDATVVVKEPAISVEKTVHLTDIGLTCSTGEELVVNVPGSTVTYCYKVINTGDTRLDVTVLDTEEGSVELKCGYLAANGGSAFCAPFVTTIPNEVTPSTGSINEVTATGNPVDAAGNDIPDLDDVYASDPAGVKPIGPAIEVEKTVHLENIGSTCSTGEDIVTGYPGDRKSVV